jgi:hypothetical protein
MSSSRSSDRGHHLVETALAERFGAAHDPASLEGLADESVVEPRRNQGFAQGGISSTAV